MSTATPAPVIWITGLSGVGKTCLASALSARIAATFPEVVHLDGDLFRQATTTDPNSPQHFSPQARRQRAAAIADLADQHSARGAPVVVSTISLFHAVQQHNRQRWPLYAEVLLQCPMTLLAKRYPQRYGPGTASSSYVGAGQNPEFPHQAELTLQQDLSPSSLTTHLDQVWPLWLNLQHRWQASSFKPLFPSGRAESVAESRPAEPGFKPLSPRGRGVGERGQNPPPRRPVR